MATPAAAPAPPFSGDSLLSTPFQDSDSESSELSAWDSRELCSHAERLEVEELVAMSVNSNVLSFLNDLLLEVYTVLRPKPVDYEQRNTLVDVFSKMANKIFGNYNGFPVVQPFGSFTMDLFTPRSDLDLSVNFSSDIEDECARKKKISVIRKFTKVLYSQQRDGIFCGVLPVVCAKVPIVNVIDRGTGIECDISVENKDGVRRSMFFKFISSLDERFKILSYLVKFWAKIHDLNCPRERTMSSMSIISLVAFHLQTRHPPILPAFSALLKDGSDFASVERNILLFKTFGSKNKESVAELFVSLVSKLASVESLWEHGLCASNYEASWISKIWKKGIGNLSVEDFLDRSQNFARAVGKVEMRKICICLRDCASNLLDFMRGKIDVPKLKTILFGRLNPNRLMSKPRLKRARVKSICGSRKRAMHAVHHDEPPNRSYAAGATGLRNPAPATAITPAILQTQSRSSELVHRPWPLVIPSGFGYGLSIQLAAAGTRHGCGILGRAPGSELRENPRRALGSELVHRPWPLIIPSGFGYGLSIQLPAAATHHDRGILGRAPATSMEQQSGAASPAAMPRNNCSSHDLPRQAVVDGAGHHHK